MGVDPWVHNSLAHEDWARWLPTPRPTWRSKHRRIVIQLRHGGGE